LKKIGLVLAIISCLLSASLLKNYKISVIASPSTLTVGTGPEDFKTIQEAINNATDGNTIFVHNGTYYENVIINKSITLVGENRDFTIINGNETSNVVSIRADNVTVQGFTIMKSGPIHYGGILVESSYLGSSIINNKIIENFYGISLFSGNNEVYGNLISNNAYGIRFVSCSSNIVSDNTIISSNYDGIYLLTSFNNFISYNVILSNNLAGVSLYDSKGNVIYGNNVSSNLLYGISLYSSSDNIISANTIENNPSSGISLASKSNNNIFCHNNFNNKVQVWSEDSTNFWSFDGEGNYWSNYSGKDLDRDGIGDTPYVIDGTNVDSSPLMGGFRAFDIDYKGETYNVTIISNSTISDFKFQLGVETGNKIIRLKPIGNESAEGFCRVMIPTRLMSYPYIILLDSEEINPTFLNVSNETHVYLYFTYLHKNQTVTIISSELYSELLCIYHDLNATYYSLLNSYNQLLNNYTSLLNNFTQLQEDYLELNASYRYLYDLNVTFYNFLDDYARLQEDFYHLNKTYYDLTNLYGELQKDFYDLNVTYHGLFDVLILLLGNFTQLQEDYLELNASYQEHLRNYSENVSNVQGLTYVLAAVTAILIIVTTYLSKRAHSSGGAHKIKRFGEE
jgi:parallel beta-helix repeat protein